VTRRKLQQTVKEFAKVQENLFFVLNTRPDIFFAATKDATSCLYSPKFWEKFEKYQSRGSLVRVITFSS